VAEHFPGSLHSVYFIFIRRITPPLERRAETVSGALDRGGKFTVRSASASSRSENLARIFSPKRSSCLNALTNRRAGPGPDDARLSPHLNSAQEKTFPILEISSQIGAFSAIRKSN